MRGKRRWIGRRVWIAGEDGQKRNGTLWFEDETGGVFIREDGVVGLLVLPRMAEGTRWGFTDQREPAP